MINWVVEVVLNVLFVGLYDFDWFIDVFGDVYGGDYYVGFEFVVEVFV